MTDLVLIRIRPATDADASLWRLAREIAAILDPLPWVLIGARWSRSSKPSTVRRSDS